MVTYDATQELTINEIGIFKGLLSNIRYEDLVNLKRDVDKSSIPLKRPALFNNLLNLKLVARTGENNYSKAFVEFVRLIDNLPLEDINKFVEFLIYTQETTEAFPSYAITSLKALEELKRIKKVFSL